MGQLLTRDEVRKITGGSAYSGGGSSGGGSGGSGGSGSSGTCLVGMRCSADWQCGDCKCNVRPLGSAIIYGTKYCGTVYHY